MSRFAAKCYLRVLQVLQVVFQRILCLNNPLDQLAFNEATGPGPGYNSLEPLIGLRQRIHSAESIIVGPWLSEVGFEVLYWRGFLANFLGGTKGKRIIVLSRGGVKSWYENLGFEFQYFDISQFSEIENLEREIHARVGETGSQKQWNVMDFERRWSESVAEKLGIKDFFLLHPSYMYRANKALFKGRISSHWYSTVTLHRPISIGGHEEVFRHANLPPRFALAKIYFNASFPDTPENRSSCTQVLRNMAAKLPVVLVTMSKKLDDHSQFQLQEPIANVHTFDVSSVPGNNLEVQTALLAKADYFVGTYGGFSYLALYLGKSSFPFYADMGVNRMSHSFCAQEVALWATEHFKRQVSFSPFHISETDKF